MRRKLYYIFLLLLLSRSLLLSGQVYYCDFEDSLSCSSWHLNPTLRPTALDNKWYIGSPGQFGYGGSSGLYVSSSPDSCCAEYVSPRQMFTLAYCDLTLSEGDYTLLFDYQVNGSTSARMSVWWLPSSVVISSGSNMLCPDWTSKGGIRLLSSAYGHYPWRSFECPFHVPSSSASGRLVFVWENSAGDVNPPSACVDNIALFSGTPCSSSPRNVRYSSGNVSWSGDASSYEVCMYNTITGSFSMYDTVSVCSWTPPVVSEGHHVIYVRSLCPSGYSGWSTSTAFFYIPGLRCVDYMDIGGSLSNTGVCYIGNFDTFIRNGQQGRLGMSDDGSSAPTSMHTLHTDPYEYDANTRKIDGGFRTVPDGEIVSVRLGAYTDSGESGRIEYKYPVLPGMSDLLDLHYAVVMMSGGHGSSLSDADMQPTFRLDVLDGQGVPLRSTCTQLDFMPGFGDALSWHNDGTVYWCDWSTVTVSLREYVGQTLTIRLTSTRCSYDTHYAYAYFTIGCRNGSLEGISCGDFSTDHFTAPDGFEYAWYRVSRPDSVISRDQELHIEVTDTNVYAVDVISPVSRGCYFSLTANPNPRYAHADFSDSLVLHDRCSNVVCFSNRSNVSVVNRQTYSETASDEPLESVYWDFGDGSPVIESRDRMVFHTFPSSGGTFRVRQIASMSGGVCQDTLFRDLTLPDVSSLESIDSVARVCSEDGFQLPNNGGMVYSDTVYHWKTANRYGCFVDNRVSVVFYDRSEDVLHDTICSGSVYSFEGKELSKSGTYTMRYSSQYGCDSVRTLKLKVLDRLSVSVPDTISVCSDDLLLDIPYEVLSGSLGDEILLSFDAGGVSAGFSPDYSCSPSSSFVQIPLSGSLRAGYYPLDISFDSRCVPLSPSRVVLAVHYSSGVIESMDGLLALYNSKYNGGYEWSSYQWYCEGVLLPGETRSFVMPDAGSIGKSYYCVLTRDDGVVIATCPIVYDGGMSVVSVSDDSSCLWYDIMGRPVSSPVERGVYIRVDPVNRQTQKILR